MVAERIGQRDALLISAFARGRGAALGLRLLCPSIEARQSRSAQRWTEPMVALDIRPRSGPIVVTIEYD